MHDCGAGKYLRLDLPGRRKQRCLAALFAVILLPGIGFGCFTICRTRFFDRVEYSSHLVHLSVTPPTRCTIAAIPVAAFCSQLKFRFPQFFPRTTTQPDLPVRAY